MKLISRTINERTYDVMCLNVKTAEVSINTYSLGSATFNTKKRTLDALRAQYETDEHKLVDIVKTSLSERLYVMTEDAFIKAAVAVNDIKEARAYFKANPDESADVEVVEG